MARSRWLVLAAALSACGFPRPDRVSNDASVLDAPLAAGRFASFGFKKASNAQLVHDLRGTVGLDGGPDSGRVTAIGFEVDRVAMTPTFQTSDPSDVVKIGNEVQLSGVASHNFTSPVTYQVISSSGQVTLYVVTVESRSLLPAGSMSASVIKDLAVADIDGDGKPDFALAGPSNGDLVIYLDTTPQGASNASFVAQPSFAPGFTPARVVLADLNADGKPEMISTTDTGTGLAIFVNNTSSPGMTSFGNLQSYMTFGMNTQAVAVGDLNGDGLLDLATTDHSNDLLHQVFNRTTQNEPSTIQFSGSATVQCGALPSDLVLADFNGDHMVDTAVADQNEGQVLVQFGKSSTGSPIPDYGGSVLAPFVGPYRLAAADLDHDGDIDLLATTKSQSVIGVFTNDGTGSMGSVSIDTAYPSVAVAVLDLDGDGYEDFVVASSGSSGAIEPFINPADGTTAFVKAAVIPIPANVVAMGVGDFNSDTVPDFVVATQGSINVYLVSAQ